mgnify:CR=1 FL=1
MAFQIADDILDYTPDNHTGKPCHNDLREHKITLPLIAVLEKADAALHDEILRHLALCDKEDASVAFISRMVAEHGGVESARETMQQYIMQAMSLLGECEPSPYRDALANLCAYVVERDR